MKTIKVPKNVQLIVSTDYHEHSEQFFKLINECKPCEKFWFITASDVKDKGFGENAFNSISDKLIEMNEAGYSFATIANHELKWIKKNKNNTNPSKLLIWWKTRPISLQFEFYNGTKLTVVHGGVTPLHTQYDLQNNTEICYVRDIDDDGKMIQLLWKNIDGEKVLVKAKEGGKFWADLYDGRFGFVAAGHSPNKDGKPKYYNYAVNLDCGVFETGQLVGQIFTSEGKLGEQITVSGTPFKPKLNIQY